MAPVMGSVTALANMVLLLAFVVVGRMDSAMRVDAATDNARYRVLWSCRGTVDGVGIVRVVGRGGIGGVGMIGGVGNIGGATGMMGGGTTGVGAGNIAGVWSAAFLCLRCCRRR